MKNERRKDQNPDPITGTPGAHPVGTGVGATAGGVAGGLIGAAAGPVGAAVGVAAGAVAGGLGGKSVAEKVNPTEEESYWREHHSTQDYARGRGYEDYQSAYRTGYLGYGNYGSAGRRFEDVETDLRTDYERENQKTSTGLNWDEARVAARAAWDRLERGLERIVGYTVIDPKENKVGTVSALWQDTSGEVAFVGVKTGWLGLGRDHVMPAEMVQVSRSRERIRIPVDEDVVKNAPTFDSDAELSVNDQEEIRRYYASHGWTSGSDTSSAARQTGYADSVQAKSMSEPEQYGGRRTSPPGSPAGSTGLAGESSEEREYRQTEAGRQARRDREGASTAASDAGIAAGAMAGGGPVGTAGETGTRAGRDRRSETRSMGNTVDEVRMPLSEERVHVGVREVEAGGVRLRKIVRTEVVNQPVELRREEAVVERVPASDTTAAGSFEEEEVYVPLRREEPVITKEAHVREEVRVRKSERRESQNVSTDVRKEDVDIDEQGR